MELLGLTKPIPMVELKKLLEHELRDKTHAEIEQLIKRKWKLCSIDDIIFYLISSFYCYRLSK